jgi:group I intron endonuclease
MKKSCVYSIINLITLKQYIGSTTDLERRISSHFRDLRNKRHGNYKLQADYDKYGETNFIFHVIEFCPAERCMEFEQNYLDSLRPHYNIALSSSAPMFGKKHSPEAIIKMSGHTPWNRGIPRTQEEREYMSARKLAESAKRPPEYKEELSRRAKRMKTEGKFSFRGNRHTQENRKVLREKHLARNRKIICENTGEIFEAQLDAAKRYGIQQGHISEHLQGKRPSIKGYRFRYV